MIPRLFLPLWCGLFLLLVSSRTQAQNGIPAAQLAALKAATVLVLVESPVEEGSGSGFLIGKENGYGYIATNEHVIDTEVKAGRSVQVVFNSGIPNREIVLRAEVLAEDDRRDLAILRVRSANLPQPLKLSSPQTARETEPIYVFGFPFGEMLATSKLHPSITVTTGTITSLRRNDYGLIWRVQVDADINEGNSGGPIVDATGRLVGIATEKIDGTKIGLGLPPSELDNMLRGRVKELGLHLQGVEAGVATYRAVAILIDPLRKVRSVSVFFLPDTKFRAPKPDAQGRFGPMAAPTLMQEFSLTLKDNEYSGPVKLQSDRPVQTIFRHQVRLEMEDGQFIWTQPAAVGVPFYQGANRPAVTPPNIPTPNIPTPEGAVPAIGTATSPGRATPGIPRNPVVTPPAGDDWLGGAAAPQPGLTTPGRALVVVESNQVVPLEPHTEAGANYYVLSVGGKVTPTMLWASDAKIVYLLEETGVLHKVAVNTSIPEFREEKVVAMQQSTKYMAMTKAGLIVGLPLLQEVWLFNPNTLQLLKRIPVGGMSGLTGSPLLSQAYAVVDSDMLSIIDLEAGKVRKQIRAREIPVMKADYRSDLGDFEFATVTPDGKYLITGSRGFLNRLRIDGDNLVHEDSSPAIGQNQNAQRVVISPDSRYVALPAGAGNANVADHPKIGPYGTYIYSIANLKTPVLAIRPGAYPSNLGFDKAAGYVYSPGSDATLKAFTASGLQEKSLRLNPKRSGYSGRVLQYLVHPQGRKLLLLTENYLFWVEL